MSNRGQSKSWADYDGNAKLEDDTGFDEGDYFEGDEGFEAEAPQQQGEPKRGILADRWGHEGYEEQEQRRKDQPRRGGRGGRGRGGASRNDLSEEDNIRGRGNIRYQGGRVANYNNEISRFQYSEESNQKWDALSKERSEKRIQDQQRKEKKKQDRALYQPPRDLKFTAIVAERKRLEEDEADQQNQPQSLQAHQPRNPTHKKQGPPQGRSKPKDQPAETKPGAEDNKQQYSRENPRGGKGSNKQDKEELLRKREEERRERMKQKPADNQQQGSGGSDAPTGMVYRPKQQGNKRDEQQGMVYRKKETTPQDPVKDKESPSEQEQPQQKEQQKEQPPQQTGRELQSVKGEGGAGSGKAKKKGSGRGQGRGRVNSSNGSGGSSSSGEWRLKAKPSPQQPEKVAGEESTSPAEVKESSAATNSPAATEGEKTEGTSHQALPQRQPRQRGVTREVKTKEEEVAEEDDTKGTHISCQLSLN